MYWAWLWNIPLVSVWTTSYTLGTWTMLGWQWAFLPCELAIIGLGAIMIFLAFLESASHALTGLQHWRATVVRHWSPAPVPQHAQPPLPAPLRRVK